MTQCNVIKERRKKNSTHIIWMLICLPVRHFVFCHRHNKLLLLCSNCFSDAGQGSRTILSATMGTSFHLTSCSRYCSRPPSLLLSLLFPSLLAVRMLRLPTISALWCTQEEECCSAMRHMHIVLCGLLHSQITRSVLRAEAVAHNKTAILIASYSARSSFRQSRQTQPIMQRAALMGISCACNVTVEYITGEILLSLSFIHSEKGFAEHACKCLTFRNRHSCVKTPWNGLWIVSVVSRPIPHWNGNEPTKTTQSNIIWKLA